MYRRGDFLVFVGERCVAG